MDKNWTYKCGQCIFLNGKRSTVGIECTEPHLQEKWASPVYEGHVPYYKYPSTRACKTYFTPKDCNRA